MFFRARTSVLGLGQVFLDLGQVLLVIGEVF